MVRTTGIEPAIAPAELQSTVVQGESFDELFHIRIRLDDHHAPETNGRIAVCRRCGMGTDGSHGAHRPYERDLGKANDWLRQQAMAARVAQFK